MKKYFLPLIILVFAFSVNAQTIKHKRPVKLESVNELPSPTTNEKVLVLDLTTNEIKFVRVSDLPISGGGSQNFQQVTDVGATTTNNITTQAMTSTGTREGGDLSVVIGDRDADNNAVQLIVNDGGDYIENISSEFRINSSETLIKNGASLSFQNSGNTHKGTINGFTGSSDASYQLPHESGIIPLTVNGQSANAKGEITISTGGSVETDVFKVPTSDFDWTSIPANYNNTTLSIRHAFDLGANTITLPANVTLSFEGGSFTNGTINYNKTTIVSPSEPSLSGITFGTGDIINNYLDATWFGVVGDDSTDNSGRLNAISTFLTNQGGGTIYLPNGTYQMADVFVRGNVSFVGQGWSTIIKAASNPTNGVLNIINPQARIINLRVNGNNTANVGIRIYNNSGQGSSIENVRVQSCNVYALEVDDTNNVTVRNSTFNDKVYINGGDSAHLVDNTFEAFTDTYALKIETTSVSKTASSAMISSNWFEATTGEGFTSAIEANGNAIYIVNNHFNLPYTGTSQAILVGSSADYTNIVGNNFQTVANDRVINIEASSNYTLVKDNRGVSNTSDYLANGDRVLIDLGDIRYVNELNYRPIGQNTNRLILDVAGEKIQYGDNANNYVAKSGANLQIQSNSRTNIYTNGNNISLQASGTNGAIYMNSPMRFRSLALTSFPSATSYLRGVGIYDFTNHDMYINNGSVWVRQLNTTDLPSVSGTFTSNDGKTVTVTNGLITNITN
jgi:hypothetical protein